MKERARPIVITGFMGAGKTSVGRALARRINRAMIDLDEFIAVREARSIRAIIEAESETRFRRIETRALSEVLGEDMARVIALGGGTWTLAANRGLINSQMALVVWLDASFEICWQRIERGKERRPLAPDMKSARLLYDARREVYALAHVCVEVNREKRVREIVSEIIAAYARTTNEN